MTPVKSNTTKFPRTSSFFVVFGLLAIVLSVPFMVRASYGATPTSISMSYTDELVGTKTVLLVTLSARDSQLPSQIELTMVTYFNGSTTYYNAQARLMSSGSGLITGTFAIPFVGVGNYLFVGSVRTTSMALILQSKIDPHIEPEWK